MMLTCNYHKKRTLKEREELKGEEEELAQDKYKFIESFKRYKSNNL
jgi:hypothetical protein